MISNRLMLFLGLPLAIFLALAFFRSPSLAIYAVPFGLLLVTVFMFQPQIDWWWSHKYPPEPDPQTKQFLEEHFEFFRELDETGQREFLLRIHYFVMGKEFTAKIGKEVPTPLKIIIAAEGVRATFGLDDYLIKKYERIVIYPHPFPTPMNQKLHHSEVHHEDGVLIFASEPVIRQFKGEGFIFNITLYEWINAFRVQWSKKYLFPSFQETDWAVFANSFLRPKPLVEASIGLPEPDMSSVGAVLYLTQKDVFRKEFPMQAAEYEKIFRY